MSANPRYEAMFEAAVKKLTAKIVMATRDWAQRAGIAPAAGLAGEPVAEVTPGGATGPGGDDRGALGPPNAKDEPHPNRPGWVK